MIAVTGKRLLLICHCHGHQRYSRTPLFPVRRRPMPPLCPTLKCGNHLMTHQPPWTTFFRRHRLKVLKKTATTRSLACLTWLSWRNFRRSSNVHWRLLAASDLRLAHHIHHHLRCILAIVPVNASALLTLLHRDNGALIVQGLERRYCLLLSTTSIVSTAIAKTFAKAAQQNRRSAKS